MGVLAALKAGASGFIGGLRAGGVESLGGTGGFVHPSYRSASLDSQEVVGWWPTRSSADGTMLPAKDLTLARVRDVLRNDPNARAAVERLVDLIVGAGLHPACQPDGVALGLTDAKARRALARSIQAEWRLFAQDPRRLCDVQKRLSMNGLFRLLARTWITGGEACAALFWHEAPGRRYATCVMPIDPDRLCNPNGETETLTRRGGVEMDRDGAPIAYHVRNAHIGDWWAGTETATWTRVPRATSWGRPIFVHGFEPEREGQTRAISPFAALLVRLRMIGKFADSELASAAANALFAAFVESDLPVEEVAQRMSPAAVTAADRLDTIVKHYTKYPVHLGGVRIPVMLPGSKITMNGTPRQTASFSSFQTAFLQSVASSLGLSYEQLSMDWSRTNYSSARAALNEVWRSITRMRAVFVEQIVEPIFHAFLEEAFDRGYVEVPAGIKPLRNGPALDGLDLFHAMPGAFTRARWIGPGRGYIDPLKEAEAAALRLESLTSTLRDECADQGDDYEEQLDQIELEEQDLKDRNLTRMSLVAAVQSNKGPKPDSEEATGPAGPGGDDRPGGGGTQDN